MTENEENIQRNKPSQCSDPVTGTPGHLESHTEAAGGGGAGVASGAVSGTATGRNIERYIDYVVVDYNDNKIGTLECLWSDHLGEPAYVGVRTGWLFGKTHVVPAESVDVNEAGHKVRLPYTEQIVKDAPSYDADAEMTADKEREICNYYRGRSSRKPSVTTAEAATMTRTERVERETGEPPRERATPEQATIQLSEEELKVGKRAVEAGGVRLRKIIRTETVNQPVELQREELVIERVPASEAHSGRQQAFTEQEVYIPLRREEAVVQKETHLREEVRARKKTQSEHEEVSGEVRREDVEIQETGEARREGKPGTRTPAEGMRQREDEPRSMRRHKTP
ncbi:MAG TPA: PRC and DUF2382 domain-containing protein [Clostridia bacterium]|nr:PRC and DUF2382 domain-containing protein [Clostridia bacterium]